MDRLIGYEDEQTETETIKREHNSGVDLANADSQGNSGARGREGKRSEMGKSIGQTYSGPQIPPTCMAKKRGLGCEDIFQRQLRKARPKE